MSTYQIVVDAPEVPHPGGTTHADFMRRAADRIQCGYSMGSNLTDTVVDLLRRVADQMDKVNPPRIPEPGQYAVVRDSDGIEWVRYAFDESPWLTVINDRASWAAWEDIDAPALVHEGAKP